MRMTVCCLLLSAGLFGAVLAARALPPLAHLQVQVQDSAGLPVPEAVVFLESPEARVLARPMRPVAIAQVDRQFSPRVTVVTLGTAVEFPNRDKVRHHVYSFSPTKTFELKLYTGSPANPVVFDRAGIAVLGCNIHDNMTAWVVVVDTPYHARSGASGRATLDALPEGAYRLRTWHADLPVGAPALDQPVRVSAGTQAVTVRLTDFRR
jgi:plastocyanin